MASDHYGPVIRHMADAVKVTTGESPFTGTEHRGRGNAVYLFTSAAISSGPEAFDYMRGLWIAAGRPIRCNCGATYRDEATYAGHLDVMNTWHHRVTPYPEGG